MGVVSGNIGAHSQVDGSGAAGVKSKILGDVHQLKIHPVVFLVPVFKLGSQTSLQRKSKGGDYLMPSIARVRIILSRRYEKTRKARISQGPGMNLALGHREAVERAQNHLV